MSDVGTWGVAAHGGVLVINGLLGTKDTLAPIVIDIENNPDGSCAGIGLSQDGTTIYFCTADYVATWSKQIFQRAQLVGHNIKYDVQKLRNWGFEVNPDQIVWDTQLAEYVKDSSKNRYGLKGLVKELFGSEYPGFTDLTGTGKKAVPVGSLPLDVLSNYCGCDVLFTYKLMQKQQEEMSPEQNSYMDVIELPAMKAVLELEERGVEINATYIKDLDKEFDGHITKIVKDIRTKYETEINLNSWQQVKRLLAEKANLHVPDTSHKTLEKHQYTPLVKDILRYRGLNKLRSTYTKPLMEGALDAPTYRLHARFNQTVTITGRLSSSEPNLQNIPVRSVDGEKVRRAFIAKEGYELCDVDYSQIQPSLMAHYSQDPKMLEVFREGKSIYSLVTDICHLTTELPDLAPKEIKAVAKILWLALAFNAGAFALSIQSGLSITKCDKFIKRMESELSEFFYWKNKTIVKAEMDGYVTTLFGRRIPVAKEWAHLGPNYIIQGGESEIMKLAQAATRHLNPVVVVHDEALFEILKGTKDKVQAEIVDLMSNVVTLSVPLRVDLHVGTNWLEAKNG